MRTLNDTQLNHNETYEQQELSRLLSAAVINASFRQALLSNPGQAIARGFRGEKFHLCNEDRKRVASIRASSLADFASQLTQSGVYSHLPAAGD